MIYSTLLDFAPANLDLLVIHFDPGRAEEADGKLYHANALAEGKISRL